MEPESLLIVLLVLACPLLMVFMHGGGHGHASHTNHAERSHAGSSRTMATPDDSLEVLRRRRDELDATIALRERSEHERPVDA